MESVVNVRRREDKTQQYKSYLAASQTAALAVVRVMGNERRVIGGVSRGAAADGGRLARATPDRRPAGAADARGAVSLLPSARGKDRVAFRTRI